MDKSLEKIDSIIHGANIFYIENNMDLFRYTIIDTEDESNKNFRIIVQI